MTTALSAKEVAAKLGKELDLSIIDTSGDTILIKKESLLELILFLKNTAGLEFDYLNDITAVDYWDYFELIYQLISIKNNHRLTVKTRIAGREDPAVPSMMSIYKGADFQEREIHDLMGIKFEGHTNLKPIVLWEGFKGYPLRKDYL